MEKTEREAAAYYNRQPKKRTGAGVLVVNHSGQLLVLKPNYLKNWLLPGGGIEDGESPLSAARRECKEEIGVDFKNLWPAYIDYREAQPNGQTDLVQFMFTTSPVGYDFLESLILQPSEIEEAKFVDTSKLTDYLSTIRARSVMAYFESTNNQDPVYIENGRVLSKKTEGKGNGNQA